MTTGRSPQRRGYTGELPPGSWPWLHDVARWIGTWCFYVVYRLRIHHRDRVPDRGPVVVVANHSAFVDGPLLFGLLGRRAVFLVKQEMFHGVLGWVLSRIGQIPVRRGSADRRPLTTGLAVLRAGGLVAVFPEGTRTGGEVAAAQHGATWLARAGGAAVLPMVCRGTRRTDDGHRRFRPRVDVLVGEPLTLTVGPGRAELAAATETLRAALAGLVADLDELRRTT